MSLSKFSCADTARWYAGWDWIFSSMLSSCCSISGVGSSPRWISCCASPRNFSICWRSVTASRSSLRASLDRLSAWYSGLWPIRRPSSFPLSSSMLGRPRKNETLSAREVEKHFDVIVSSVHRNHLCYHSRPSGIDFQREKSAGGKHARGRPHERPRHRQPVLRAEQRYTWLPVTN